VPLLKVSPNWNSLVAYLPKRNFNFCHNINLPYPFVNPIRIIKRLWIMCHSCGRLCRKISRAIQTPTKRIFHIMAWDSNSLDISYNTVVIQSLLKLFNIPVMIWKNEGTNSHIISRNIQRFHQIKVSCPVVKPK